MEAVINERKLRRKLWNEQGIMMLSYIVLQLGVMFVIGIAAMVKWYVQYGGKLSNQMIEQKLEQLIGNGVGPIIATLLGMGVILLYRRKQLFQYSLRVQRKKMDPKTFMLLLICFMSPQILISFTAFGAESILNLFGYTIMEDLNYVVSGSNTISMMVYTVILGPLAEEVLFRGVILRDNEKYGKGFAILFSAVLFGIFHGDLIQGFFAILVGVILAYVTMEYSIKWAILMHIINNGIAEGLCLLEDVLSENMHDIVYFSMFGSAFIFGLYTVIKNRKKIMRYINENGWEKGIWRKALSSIWLVIPILISVWMAFDGIKPMK